MRRVVPRSAAPDTRLRASSPTRSRPSLMKKTARKTMAITVVSYRTLDPERETSSATPRSLAFWANRAYLARSSAEPNASSARPKRSGLCPALPHQRGTGRGPCSLPSRLSFMPEGALGTLRCASTSRTYLDATQLARPLFADDPLPIGAADKLEKCADRGFRACVARDQEQRAPHRIGPRDEVVSRRRDAVDG
jgi:hypothetical protein